MTMIVIDDNSDNDYHNDNDDNNGTDNDCDR